MTPHPRPSSLALLRIAAHVEIVSLLTLLINLVTVHTQAVASLAGPVHGCAYLFVLLFAAREAGTVRHPGVYRGLVPGVGGLLALRLLGRRPVQPLSPAR